MPHEETSGSRVYDWNRHAAPVRPLCFELLDETLRDGIQSPSVVDPSLDDKLRLVHLMSELAIGAIKAGMPCAGPRARADTLAIVKEIRDAKLAIKPACAARTVVKDIAPIVEISQALGVPIEVYTFIGASTVRLLAEGWSLADLLRHVEQAVRFALREGLPVCLVTEDTTRARPEILAPLFRHALALGVGRLCLCDTTGHATPGGVHNLFAWTREVMRSASGEVALDFHGHNDRGLAVANALAAVAAGADRVHGTALGIGERVGNAAIDLVMINLKLDGLWPHDISPLLRYCETAARACHVDIPVSYPVVGRDAFRTATGVHAAAIIKAWKKGEAEMADCVYASINASTFGRAQVIEIGHMSGLSNVTHWLSAHGVAYDLALARRILAHAKRSRALLGEDEIWDTVRAHDRELPASREVT